MAQVMVDNAATKNITVEEKFEAALSVIRGLPKNGSYKPTHEMMLKFYSYYKQATEGPCTKTKPWAWDVINKAKWEAWSKLGDMPKTKAMENYVLSLMKIVEAMPATDNVQTFIKLLGDFYEVVELPPPKQYKKFREMTSTPLKSNGVPVLNGNGAVHYELNALSKNLNGHESPASDEGHEVDAEETMHQSSETAKVDRNTQERKTRVSINEHNEVQPLPSDSEDEFCDTAENMEVSSSQQYPSLTAKDSLTNSYTMVNSDGNMGSSSSSKSDSVSTLEETFDTETTNKDMINDTVRNTNEQGTTDSVKVRARGGEYGARGADNKMSSQHRDSFTHSGRGPYGNQDMQNPDSRRQRGNDPGGNGGGRAPAHSYSEVQDRIATTLLQLQQDMNSVLNRLTILEALTVEQQAHRTRTMSGDSNSAASSPRHQRREAVTSSWWPLPEISPRTAVFIVLWPFFVKWIFSVLRRRKNMRT